MYLFKLSPGKWIFGDTVDSECPAGIFRVEPSSDRSRVSIRYTARDLVFRNIYAEPVTNFVDANGAPYANFAALQSASDGFFDASGGSTLLVNKSGEVNSLQIGTMDVIPNIATTDFALAADAPFLLKNDGLLQVELQVKLINSSAWITTRFETGWNPELLKAVKANAMAGLTLKYGY